MIEVGGSIMSLGKNIQKLRKEKKLSQEQLAQKCNVSRQTISRWESDEVLPDTNNLITLAKLFNVTLDSMVFDESQEYTKEKNIKWKILGIISLILNIVLVISLVITINPFSFPKDIEGVYYTTFAKNPELELIVDIEKNEKGYLTKLYIDDKAHPITTSYIIETDTKMSEKLNYDLYISKEKPLFYIKYNKDKDYEIVLEAAWINNLEKTFYLTRQ